MVVGHGVSCLMLRQMEFDADRYETRVAGSDVFVQSCQKLGLLSVASSAAMNELQIFLTLAPQDPNSTAARQTLEKVKAFTTAAATPAIIQSAR